MADEAIFDHYEVLRHEDGSLHELGRGAMGITYKAFDTNLRCHVALKVINGAAIDSDLARQRFVREARAAAQLRHRHVASVFHLGLAGGTYFYAMEYIDGETLESLLRRSGPLDPALALQITTQVARALNAAQKHQLVHRDIKPSNLMLVQEDEELVVKVIDFGLAKSSRKDDTEDAVTLSLGGFVGTPHFASPEQLEEKEIDVRSDLYSLGVTLWYMLAGQVPFGGSLAQVMSQHLHARPPVEQFTQLPEPLRALLARMLEKDPADRPQTALELRQELESCRALLLPDPAREVTLPALQPGQQEHETLQSVFYVGACVAGRYAITEDLGEETAGWSFRAHETAANTDVRLVVLTAEFSQNAEALTQLEREVEKLQSVSHPHLLAVAGLERLENFSFLVLAWTNGFSLLELLRARQEIGVSEVLPLVQQIAEGVDFAVSRGWPRLDLSLAQIALDFSPAGAPAPDRPSTAWPPFSVKLNALGLLQEFGSSETWAGGQTMIAQRAPAAREASAAPPLNRHLPSLAALIYELLGGTLPSALLLGTGARYVPLAGLSEQGNALLQQALERPGAWASAQAFFYAFQQAAAENQSRPQPGSAQVGSRFPIPKKRGWPILALAVAGGSAVVICVIAFLIFNQAPRDVSVVALSLPEPTPAIPAATPQPTAPIAPAASPSLTPPDVRRTLLRNRLAEAEQEEAAANWPAALAAYVALARDFPESDLGKVRLELSLAKLRPALEKMSDADFAPLLQPVTDAAQLNVISAMMILGSHLRKTTPVAAFNWFCAAAALGHAPALVQVGLMYSNGAGVQRDFAQAAAWFQQASDKGDAAGQTCLAECYLYGRGVVRDEARAVQILQEAVAGGDPRAMNLLGTCFHQGVGTAQNFGEAWRLFTQARALKFGDATGNLGVLYINGDGVPKDVNKAVGLFEQGAREGNASCMFLLARYLELGTGPEANAAQARAWYQKAAAAGHPRALEWCRSHGISVAPK